MGTDKGSGILCTVYVYWDNVRVKVELNDAVVLEGDSIFNFYQVSELFLAE